MPADRSSAGLLSVIVPAYQEAASIEAVTRDLSRVLRELPCPTELIVVDDGSRDGTAIYASQVPGVRVVRNPINLGYGHSLLRGLAVARGDLIGICDADGSYPAEAMPRLVARLQEGVDHAIGVRTGVHIRDRWLARQIYRWLCGYVVGCRVPDANSGLRVFRREIVDRLRADLCRGFSFTTSLTLASLMAGYVVAFEEIPYDRRVGRSHVRFRDTLRTAQYLFQLIALYNPIKLFLPLVGIAAALAASAFIVAGLGIWSQAALAGSLMTAVALLLVGLAAHAYIVSRVGLASSPPPSVYDKDVRSPPVSDPAARRGATPAPPEHLEHSASNRRTR
jgi:glycosyltransferase involved in cell wall biosynthesis